jgi:hypothetical protein
MAKICIYPQKDSFVDPAPCILLPAIWQSINVLLCEYCCTVSNLEVKSNWVAISITNCATVKTLDQHCSIVYISVCECRRDNQEWWAYYKLVQLLMCPCTHHMMLWFTELIKLQRLVKKKACSPAPTRPQLRTDWTQITSPQPLQYSDRSAKKKRSIRERYKNQPINSKQKSLAAKGGRQSMIFASWTCSKVSKAYDAR